MKCGCEPNILSHRIFIITSLKIKIEGDLHVFINSFLSKVGCVDFEREPNRQSLQQINLSSPKFLHSETFGELFSNRAFDWGSAVAILGKFSNEETHGSTSANFCKVRVQPTTEVNDHKSS